MKTSFSPVAPPADAKKPAEGPTLQLHRLTVRYDSHHDRLRVDAVDQTGATCAMWITRRLAAAWLATLAQWLQQASPAAKAAPVEVKQQAVAMESAVIVGRREREAAPAVPPQAVPRLVAAIDLNRRDHAWQMVFRAPPDAVSAQPFNGVLTSDSATVHQLAQVMVRSVKQAQWGDPLPLGWLDPQATAAPAAPGTLLN